jgi:hypothetical protein
MFIWDQGVTKITFEIVYDEAPNLNEGLLDISTSMGLTDLFSVDLFVVLTPLTGHE